MKRFSFALVLAGCLATGIAAAENPAAPAPPLGLPPIPYPEGKPPSADKVALGEKLFNDARFSKTGKVSCATCHDAKKAFTDSPLQVSKGIDDQMGTRNAPTVVNAVYFRSMFWDGRSPSLEDQALHPFLNPVEMGLQTHEPILDVVRSDADYGKAFQNVFGKQAKDITMDEVTSAIAAFERMQVAGDSPFDHSYFKGENTLTEKQKLGLDVFVNKGRCVSCHRIEQTQALFTDNRFHNVGVGITQIQEDVPQLAGAFLKAKATLAEVDVRVLTDARTSELGRFAVSRGLDDLGSFKTPTLRNIAVTAPYMHDGSMATLQEVVDHYNNGGITDPKAKVNDFLSGGIRPLNLTDAEADALVAFMESLTSPMFEAQAKASSASKGGKE